MTKMTPLPRKTAVAGDLPLPPHTWQPGKWALLSTARNVPDIFWDTKYPKVLQIRHGSVVKAQEGLVEIIGLAQVLHRDPELINESSLIIIAIFIGQSSSPSIGEVYFGVD